MDNTTLYDIIQSLLIQLDAKNHQIEFLQGLVEHLTEEKENGKEEI